ncbi:hypothetical protein HPP92_010555 [Vanilla planifolia]|uniref:Uncharacterized protein n=1 Tax=Vanilla planifolia TaxID=51239 RepID=A0A835V468_VANPL|nr:hypothetical protein HPP92_010795 [Vanilla planifolia]KAG0482471.1 hypothetical protein HPP92_010555 [Vanilla planifolia]
MVKDNDKKTVMAVQSLRNILMGSTMVATSSFLICCGLLAFTSTVSDKRRLVLSSMNRVEVTRKCAVLVPAFLTVFFCHVLSITFLNQVTMVVNILIQQECKITVEQATLMLAKGMLMTTIGNRLFFAAMPLVLWLYSPVLVFACSVLIVAALFSVDIVRKDGRARLAAVNDGNGEIIPT